MPEAFPDAWRPPEPLTVREQWAHPFTRMLLALGYEVREEYPGAGRRTLYGMSVDVRSCRIVYLLAEERTILAIHFQRLGGPRGLLSPFRELQRFFALAADPRAGLETAAGKIKVQRSSARHLDGERLTRAYRRCFAFRVLGHENGLPWVGSTGAEYRRLMQEKHIAPLPPRDAPRYPRRPSAGQAAEAPGASIDLQERKPCSKTI